MAFLSKLRTVALVLSGIFVVAGSASAASVTFDLSIVFTGPGNPTGSPVAVIDDGGGAGSVTITMDLSALSGGEEKVQDWWFNSAVDPAGLSFIYQGGSSTGPEAAISFQSSFNDNTGNADGLKADGDGFFDILFSFPTGADSSFGAGEVVTYSVTGDAITAATFNIFSAPGTGGSSGPFLSVAHVLGTPNGESVHMGAVPAPAAVWLLLSAIGILGFGAPLKIYCARARLV